MKTWMGKEESQRYYYQALRACRTARSSWLYVDVMVLFARREGVCEIRVGVLVSIGVGLEENPPRGKLRVILCNDERSVWIGEMEYGLFKKKSLELFKGQLASGGLVPWMVLFSEVDEGASDG